MKPTKPTKLSSAIFLGRFQPFHIGHRSIVEKILASYPSMTLIIGSSDKSGTDENPWSYQERLAIILENLSEELLSRVTIYPLADVPDDDIWCENLKNLLLEGGCHAVTGGFIGDKSSVSYLDSSFKKELTGYVLFTGNPWVRDICARHDIQTDWIDSYMIDISGTKIREMIRKGEDVSQWAKMNL